MRWARAIVSLLHGTGGEYLIPNESDHRQVATGHIHEFVRWTSISERLMVNDPLLVRRVGIEAIARVERVLDSEPVCHRGFRDSSVGFPAVLGSVTPHKV